VGSDQQYPPASSCNKHDCRTKGGERRTWSLWRRIRQPQAQWRGHFLGPIVCSGHPRTREGRAAHSQQGAGASGFVRDVPDEGLDRFGHGVADTVSPTAYGSNNLRISSQGVSLVVGIGMFRWDLVTEWVSGSCIDPSVLPFQGQPRGRRLGKAHRTAAPRQIDKPRSTVDPPQRSSRASG
jgi:hypothetical protein